MTLRLLALAVSITLWIAAPASATTVDANWFSNGSGSGVIDPPGPTGPERLRLQGSFNVGFHEGTVVLPFAATWTIEALIRNDSQFDIPSEFVEIRIDGVLVETLFNTPLGAGQPFEHQITGDSFDYRFDFSSPSVDEGSHLIVQRGTVTAAAEPALLALLASAAAALSRRR